MNGKSGSKEFPRIMAHGLVVLALVAAAGCGSKKKGGGGSGGTSGPPTAPKALVVFDREQMNAFDSATAQRIDAKNDGLFTAIFGGQSGAALAAYFNERITRIFDEKDTETAKLAPATFRTTKWQSDEDERPEGAAQNSVEDNEVLMGAANLGTHFWFLGVLDRVTPVITTPTETIFISSSRAGIMLIGPGYRRAEKLNSGQEFIIPSEYRQATLLHEARHSDCTGGVKQSELDVVRKANNVREFEETYKRHECGHLHKRCPKGHDYAGYQACDGHAWGAYAISAIFSETVSLNLTGTSKSVMDAKAVDQMDRLLVDVKKMIQGGYGKPDMTSKGVTDN